MGRDKGVGVLSFNIEPQKASPLDARTVVSFQTDLTDPNVWASSDGNEYLYTGLVVSVVGDAPENNGVYVLTNKPFTNLGNWSKLGAGASVPNYDLLTNKPVIELEDGTLITIEGTKTLSDYDIHNYTKLSEMVNDTEFITKTVDNLDNYYKKTETMTTTEIETLVASLQKARVIYSETIPTDPEEETIYLVPDAVIVGRVNQWFLIDGVLTVIGTTSIDMTDYYKKTEADAKILELSPHVSVVTVNALPATGNPNTIYMNTTDGNKYIYNGTFQSFGTSMTGTELNAALDLKQNKLIAGNGIDIDDTTNTISSQAGNYNNPNPSVVAVGGIVAGTTFNNMSVSDVFDAMFYPELFPSLIDPSVAVNLSTNILEVGQSITLTVSSLFNRGNITPAYGTSGYRSGLPNSYDFDSVNYPSTSLNFSREVDVTSTTEQAIVYSIQANYDEGEQPLSSKGTNFGTKLEAGSVTGSNTLNFVFPYYGTTVDSATMTAQPLAVIGEFIEIELVAESDINKQSIEYSTTKNACTGVEFYNTTSTKWEWLNGNRANSVNGFTATTLSRVINGVTQTYRKYTHNGTMIGQRNLRFYV